MFFKFEELFIQTVVAELSYTMAQILDQALDKIKKTRIFTNSVTTWNSHDPNDKNWQNVKAHFITAYDDRLESGPTANTTVYHGAAAALSTGDSLGSITNSIAQMNMANNANIRAMKESNVDRQRRATSSPCRHPTTTSSGAGQSHRPKPPSPRTTTPSVGCISTGNGGRPILPMQ